MSGIQQLLVGAVPAGAAADADFKNTVLLLPGSGTNGAQNNTFLDSSTNAFSITRNGNTTQGTFSPFSQTGWSNYFDGSGDYLTTSSSSAFGFGTSGNFSVECWAYITNYTNYITLFSTNVSGPSYPWRIGGDSSGNLYWHGAASVILTTTAATKNAWHHICVTRESGRSRLFIDGVLKDTVADTNDYGSGTVNFEIGNFSVASQTYYGYLSNLRIVNGSVPAEYQTSSTTIDATIFTPPTSKLTAVTNTSFLSCQSNRFIDNSTNGLTLTAYGDVSVQAFSPFAPTAAYSAATNGGSGYFDGSGDYLTTASSSAFAWGTGDFSMECWIYRTVSGFMRVLPFSDDLGNIAIDSSNRIELWTGSAFNSGSYTVPVNAWTHLCATRQSGTCRLFLNGVLAATTSNSFNKGNGAAEIGASSLYGEGITGYLSNVRHVKGGVPSAYSTSSTTVGTQIFTPATAPLTSSDSLTAGSLSLLLNFTNAGITDATAKNDLETVGNAQISTAQSKFGGASMYFDGTGDRLFVANSTPNLSLKSSDYTIEMWVYANSFSGTPYLISSGSSGGTYWAMYFTTGGALGWGGNTGANQFTAGTVSTSVWTHIAVSQSGSNVYWFVDGTLVLTKTATDVNNANWVATNQVSVGSNFGSNDFNGYIDDLRITKGIARYTANFTAPTKAFALQ